MHTTLPIIDIYDDGKMFHVLRRSPGNQVQIYPGTQDALQAAQWAAEAGDAQTAADLRRVSAEVRKLNAARAPA